MTAVLLILLFVLAAGVPAEAAEPLAKAGAPLTEEEEPAARAGTTLIEKEESTAKAEVLPQEGITLPVPADYKRAAPRRGRLEKFVYPVEALSGEEERAPLRRDYLHFARWHSLRPARGKPTLDTRKYYYPLRTLQGHRLPHP